MGIQATSNMQGGQQMPSQEDMAEQQEMMMEQICSAEARDRIGRIKVVKPEKAAEIENMLLQMAMNGKLQGQVDDDALKKLLAAEGAAGQTSVQMKRRNIMDDDDW